MNQDEFFKRKTNVRNIYPGGRGSGRKSWPLYIKNLKEQIMKTRVTKIIRLQTAHQLSNSYSKECQTMHGHSYKCEATFEGDVDPNTGMIMDFKIIGELLQNVEDKYDHQSFTMESFGQNPTAENMCQDIFNMIRAYCMLLVKIRLWETETCYAEISY